MPSDATDEAPRVVVDEASFDLRDLSDLVVEEALHQFNETLGALLRERTVGIFSDYGGVECRDGCQLVEFLCVRGTCEVDPDTLRRCISLLDRCAAWDDQAPEACSTVRVDGKDEPFAFSCGLALTMTLRRRGVACLVLPTASRRGFVPVEGNDQTADVYFFAENEQFPVFWRHLFVLEDVPEEKFSELALDAFPALVLHPNLTFRKFDGTYAGLRDKVVRVLSALNDHFPTILVACRGLPHEVCAAMGRHGVDVSPESPNTRRSERLMGERDVSYDGRLYRCEWHAKIEPHRNRIHFTLPNDGPHGRVLVGIFVDHLRT